MLEKLKEQYRLSLPEKVKTIRSLLNNLRAGDSEAQANLRLLAIENRKIRFAACRRSA